MARRLMVLMIALLVGGLLSAGVTPAVAQDGAEPPAEIPPDLNQADDWAIGLGFDLCKCPKGRGDVPPLSATDIRSAMFAEKAEMIRVRAGCVPGLVVAGPPGLCNKFRPN